MENSGVRDVTAAGFLPYCSLHRESYESGGASVGSGEGKLQAFACGGTGVRQKKRSKPYWAA